MAGNGTIFDPPTEFRCLTCGNRLDFFFNRLERDPHFASAGEPGKIELGEWSDLGRNVWFTRLR